MSITPDQARELLDGATPGPWDAYDPGDNSARLYGLHDERLVKHVRPQESAGSYMDRADGELAAAAPDLAQTIAGMEWEWRCEADLYGTWAGLTTWESSPDYARATMQRRHRYPVRLVRRLVGPGEVTAPTLAEELRYRADLLDNGDPDGDTPQALRTLADRAEQVERDLAEARAEVGRLTAENEQLRRTDNFKEFNEFLGVQKGAESNAETPDPADVKPGEAWKANIWFDGVRQPGTAIKSAGSSDWVVVRDDGSHTAYCMNEYVELVSRLVPAPRVITNHDELDKLAEGVVIATATGIARVRQGWYWLPVEGAGPRVISAGVSLPVTVLWEPEA